MRPPASTQRFGHYSFEYVLTPDDRKRLLPPLELDVLRGGEPGFVGEEVVRGIPIIFEGEIWETVIAAVEGKAYKISLMTTGGLLERIELLNSKISRLFDGSYSRAEDAPAEMAIWDCADGNIVLHQQNREDSFLVITATSQIVRTFRKQNANRSSKSASNPNQPLSLKASHCIAAVTISGFWLAVFWIAITHHWWVVLKVPIGIIAFLCTVFAIKEVIMRFTTD